MKEIKIDNHIFEQLIAGKPQPVEADGISFCLAKRGDEVFAFQRKCPHAGADLSEGFMDALGNVVCPLHQYKFSVINGRNISGEGYFLKRYKVEKRAEALYILIP